MTRGVQDPRTYVPARERTPFAHFELRRSHLKTSIPGAHMAGTYLSTRPDVDRETAHAASLSVCARAHDVADARALLTTLGLI